jgi:hypothetical protein
MHGKKGISITIFWACLAGSPPDSCQNSVFMAKSHIALPQQHLRCVKGFEKMLKQLL